MNIGFSVVYVGHACFLKMGRGPKGLDRMETDDDDVRFGLWRFWSMSWCLDWMHPAECAQRVALFRTQAGVTSRCYVSEYCCCNL